MKGDSIMADNIRKIQHTRYVPFDLDTYVFYHNDGKAITPANVGGLHPFEYSNWIDEMLSWHDNCYIHAGLNPANIYRVKGPDALKFFSDICVNTFQNFPVGKSKHGPDIPSALIANCAGSTTPTDRRSGRRSCAPWRSGSSSSRPTPFTGI